MRKRSIFTVPAAAAGVIALGLTLGAALPTPGIGSPTPTIAISDRCEEDMPCWVGSPQDDSTYADPYTVTAWQTWEEQEGARKLKVDPSRPFRVDYMMSTDGVPENTDAYDLVLTGKDGRSYVFRATYTDQPA